MYFWDLLKIKFNNIIIRQMKKLIPFILALILAFPILAQNKSYHLLIGTYTEEGKSQGIYSYEINPETGAFTQKSVTKGISNPSFLAIAPDKQFVYSVSESSTGSAANAFRFDEKSAKLSLLNASLTNSDGPCFISVTDKHVFTANYGGGSLSVFGRKADGSLTDALQVIQHTGKSIDAERQGEPHVHQVIVSPDKKYVVANDLGTDKVTVYQYNPTAATDILVPFDTLTAKLGSGPRHAAFSKDGSKLYLAQEIDGTVSVLKMKSGKLSLLQETTVDRKPGTVNRTADIHLSSDGRFLYVTNRGTANNITCFAVGADGKLTFKQQVPTGGDGPRNFAITPDGHYILVAHQFTNNITVFKRNAISGALVNTGKQLQLGAPVCLIFY